MPELNEKELHLAKCLSEYAKEKGIEFGTIKVEANFKDSNLITFRIGQEETYQNIKI
jgi:hypothetical protein